ncbi:MAG: GNAT family N-acetyltransferase [Minicystis sp.]
MQTFQAIVARTPQEIRDAQRVRWAVYGEEERLLSRERRFEGREIDARDEQETTSHLLVYAGGEAVGTVRLLRPSAERESGCLGLDLEAKWDLGALAAPGIAPAEVTRYCVLRQHRHTGVTTALFAGLYAESVRRGITHWVAGANMETDLPEDAAVAYRVAQEKGFCSARFAASPRVAEVPRTPRRRACYTEEQRRQAAGGDLTGIALPRTLALFASRMGARFIGPPVYDTGFDVFALPLVATLADLAATRANRSTGVERARDRGELRA